MAASSPFMFPGIESALIPDPSPFFSPDLLSGSLPTNSYFQNYVLGNGDEPEYIHPYLVKSNSSSLSFSFASQFLTSLLLYQVLFDPDLTISALHKPQQSRHMVSSFTDLALTLDLPSSNLSFFLVRGSPFLTCQVSGGGTALSITTNHPILSLTSNTTDGTKYKLKLQNGQTWLIYSSFPINFTHAGSSITSSAYSGIIRFAALPDSDPEYESIYDKYSPSYPVSGKAEFSDPPFSFRYAWDKKGSGELLMLAHPLHLQLLSVDDNVTVLNDFKFNSIDGELVGVVGDSWKLKLDPIPITWNSIQGVNEEAFPEIISALTRDVEGLSQLSSSMSANSYFYGKSIARAARLALIAEEVSLPEVIPAVATFLDDTITPWLEGTYAGNAFLYEGKWGGLVTKQGSVDPGADFGFGVYNDHHFHLGYFLYGIAVLAKIDPDWGAQYKPQAYALLEDFMTYYSIDSGSTTAAKNYTRLRNFDSWKLHSWAGGLTVFRDGRNQESSSEAVNGYYAAALLGLAYGDAPLVGIASTITALEIKATQTWWHAKEDDTLYPPDFTRENRLVGIVWSTKRDAGLWFAAPEAKEIRLGIQVLPVVPITEVLFSEEGFAREAVTWVLPALGREGVTDAWKGFVYAMEGIYDQEGALGKIRNLAGHDDGNSLTNLLWWVHSRNATVIN